MPNIDPSPALFTDLYQLTMAQTYWHSGQRARATFSLFIRNYPPDRAYFVFAGLADVLRYLEELRFSREDVAFLVSLNMFDEDFLSYLRELRFTGDVRAMSEGSVFFANEPVMEVDGPVIEAQIVETFLLNQINFQSVLATKSSRLVHAAGHKTVVDFAARRTHGTDAANKMALASYMVGFAGTSNTMAGALYGIPTFGTMAHSFVTIFEEETDSFQAYARSFPDTSTFLVDTYDTLGGVTKAIAVAKEMKRSGHALRAIRLDSGDLLDLSVKTRALLDEAGFKEVQIFASGGLDEFGVEELLGSGAPIDAFGVGTKVGVSADAPWTDCAYKLVEYDGRPVLKLSPGKQSLPGPKQVYRHRDGDGRLLRDVIARAEEPPVDGAAQPLLREVMQKGRLVAPLPILEELTEAFGREFASLPDRHKALRSPAPYEVATSAGLEKLRLQVTETVTRGQAGASRLR